MAKPLPRIDAPDPSSQPRKPEVQANESRTNAPVIREGYSRSMSHVRRVDIRLPVKHRKILSAKIRQLQDTGARLQDGTHVTDKTKAILWILENEVQV